MTEPLFKLHPLFPYWLLAILFVVTATVLIWLEAKKAIRYKNVRMACVICLLISLLGILLEPTVRSQKQNFGILVTENSDPRIIDSLKEEFSGAKFQLLGEDSRSASVERLLSPNEISVNETKIITGNGLSAAARDLFETVDFVYYPASTPAGIIDLRIPKLFRAQSPALISGVFNNNLDSAKIILEGPGGKMDSVFIQQKGVQNFKLSFIPKQSGTFTYTLWVNDTRETIPVNVEPQDQMRILVVQMFPTFETGYLKNILSHDHRLVFRYQVSKNNFRYEYINHTAIRTDRLANEILENFDLLIIDTDALKLLSSSERKNLEQSVSNGLGVLLVFNELPKSNRTIQSILPINFKSTVKDTAQFVLTKKLTLPAWQVEPVNDGRIIPTIKNSDRILAGYVYKGFGKLGFQLLQETYKLTLEGDSSSYRNLWTTILQRNSRTVSEKFKVSIENDFPIYPREPVQIRVIGSSTNPPILVHNGIEIPMAEDVVIDDLWKAKVWPDESGWQEIQIKGDSTKHFYFVSEKGVWGSLAAANSIRNTKAMASSTSAESSALWEYRPFAPYIFYVMFLVCAAVLWLVPKI